MGRDLPQLLGDSILGRSEILGHLLFVDQTEVEGRAQTGDPSTWAKHIVHRILLPRLASHRAEYALTPEAVEAHNEFSEQSQRREAHTELESAHQREVPRLGLRLALGFHLARDKAGESAIGLEAYEQGRDLAETISAIHCRCIRKHVERIAEHKRRALMERLVDRIRVHGPMRKRDLVRTFDIQRDEHHVPAIELAIDLGLLERGEGDVLSLCSEASVLSVRQVSPK